MDEQMLNEEQLPDEQISAEDEFDLTGAGTPTGRFDFTITGFDVSEKKNGVQHVVTFESEVIGFPLPIGYWFTHTNPDAQRAGRGQLRRIAKAATGQPKYSRTSLVGRVVSAEIYEDDDGFARLKNYRPAASNGSEA